MESSRVTLRYANRSVRCVQMKKVFHKKSALDVVPSHQLSYDATHLDGSLVMM